SRGGCGERPRTDPEHDSGGGCIAARLRPTNRCRVSESALLKSPAPTVPALDDLILLPLLPEKKRNAPKKLRTDLVVFFRTAPPAEVIEQAVAALKPEGFVTPKGQRLTDAGRARALQFLGIEKLPPRANWRVVKAKYLVPRALGLAPD